MTSPCVSSEHMRVVAFGILALTLPALAAANDTPALIAAQIDDILSAEALTGAHAGVYIKRLEDGRELYAHDADSLLIPASNMKLVSSAAALHHFGPDYRFATEVYLVAPGGSIQNGSAQNGDIIIKGYGDPLLTAERAWNLASRTYYAGVRSVGSITIDDSYFAGSRMANGWEQDRTDNAYMAPTGAVSIGFNTVLVHVQPGGVLGGAARVLVEPASDYARIDNTVATVGRGRTYVNVDVAPLADRSHMRITGRINTSDPGRTYWRRIDNPPIFAGEVIKAMLQQVGVKVHGSVRVGVVPPEAVRLITVSSPALAEIISTLNKNSNNFMAEQIALALGAARFGAPGTWDKAQAAIDGFLTREVGLTAGSYKIGNASGLHDVNRMSPRQIVAVLEYMHKNAQLSPEFSTSLAVAGASGTLTERMRSTEAARLLRAKTGTLSVASALSGYVTTRSGNTLAFSVIVNNYKSPVSEVWHVQDQLGALLARLRFTATSPSMAGTLAPDSLEVAVP